MQPSMRLDVQAIWDHTPADASHLTTHTPNAQALALAALLASMNWGMHKYLKGGRMGGLEQALAVVTCYQGTLFVTSLLNSYLPNEKSYSSLTQQACDTNRALFFATLAAIVMCVGKGGLALEEWKEFAAWCLPTTVLAPVVYRAYGRRVSLQILRSQLICTKETHKKQVARRAQARKQIDQEVLDWYLEWKFASTKSIFLGTQQTMVQEQRKALQFQKVLLSQDSKRNEADKQYCLEMLEKQQKEAQESLALLESRLEETKRQSSQLDQQLTLRATPFLKLQRIKVDAELNTLNCQMGQIFRALVEEWYPKIRAYQSIDEVNQEEEKVALFETTVKKELGANQEKLSAIDTQYQDHPKVQALKNTTEAVVKTRERYDKLLQRVKRS